ncbi:hypothetical protein [Acinetobacter lactucae]|uniref:hypothetical protein n=1 Tax=Acinetobacter lactucae TaxID=1785128 RepID=UPI0015F660A9|nr:hypothetical protein [Acinetobacter lactucae]
MSDISIDEYKKRKKAFEEMLQQQLQELISKFESDVGVNIQNIHLTFSDISCLGQVPKSLLTNVKVLTDISD